MASPIRKGERRFAHSRWGQSLFCGYPLKHAMICLNMPRYTSTPLQAVILLSTFLPSHGGSVATIRPMGVGSCKMASSSCVVRCNPLPISCTNCPSWTCVNRRCCSYDSWDGVPGGSIRGQRPRYPQYSPLGLSCAQNMGTNPSLPSHC